MTKEKKRKQKETNLGARVALDFIGEGQLSGIRDDISEISKMLQFSSHPRPPIRSFSLPVSPSPASVTHNLALYLSLSFSKDTPLISRNFGCGEVHIFSPPDVLEWKTKLHCSSGEVQDNGVNMHIK